MKDLYPFQVDAVKFHMKHKYTLNSSELGTGKTVMALATAKTAGMDATVFCPAFLKINWEREARDLGVRAQVHSYSMLHKVKSTSGFWIADEVHALKNPTAKRTQQFYKLLKEVKPDYLIGLTGTPIKNRLPDFWSLLAFMSQVPIKGINGLALEGQLQKYYQFCRYFCKSQRMEARGRSFEKFYGVQEKKIPELKALLKDKYIRFEVSKVLQDLPEMTKKFVEMDLEPSEEMRELFDKYMEGSKVDITGKVKSAALKAEFTANYVTSIIEESDDESVLVFTDHIDAAAIIHRGIPRSAMITGKTPMKERQVVVDYFQAKKIRVIVATIGALSTGVTLHAARHVVFNDWSWTPSDNLQAEKRIHRIGQKNACFSHHIVASDTDRHIFKVLESKLDTMRKVLDA
jgi:SWI/SNF-related matrix-associated actin-dependent regulator 1 of chromatin subfamily A